MADQIPESQEETFKPTIETISAELKTIKIALRKTLKAMPIHCRPTHYYHPKNYSCLCPQFGVSVELTINDGDILHCPACDCAVPTFADRRE